MRVSFFTLFVILSGFWLAPPARAQVDITDLDSFAIVKPKMRGELYQFTDKGPKEIEYRLVDNLLTKDSLTAGLSGFSSTILTELTGLGSSSGREGLWKVSGSIACNDTLPDWHVTLYCRGYQQKDRERIRNDDGSVSMHTTTTNVYHWNDKATGVIMESMDTAGSFQIIIGIPEDDDLVKKWHQFIYNQGSLSQNVGSNNKRYTEPSISVGKNNLYNQWTKTKNYSQIFWQIQIIVIIIH